MTTIRDEQGWSVKDHLAHLMVWEQSLLALLEGRSRELAMGLDVTDTAGHDLEAINAEIQQRFQRRSLEQIREELRQSHTQVRATIAGLTDADLLLPYSHYQPNDPPEDDGPVLGWIMGNTVGHFDEHRGWIEALLAR